MNDFLNTKNGASILKNFYGNKKTGAPPGPTAQMNASMPMIQAIRQKWDMIGKTQLMQNPSANKIMHKPGVSPVPQGGLKHPPMKRRGF